MLDGRACLGDLGVAVHGNERTLPYKSRHPDFNLKYDFQDYANIVRSFTGNLMETVWQFASTCNGARTSAVEEWEQILTLLDHHHLGESSTATSSFEKAQRSFGDLRNPEDLLLSLKFAVRSGDTRSHLIFLMLVLGKQQNCDAINTLKGLLAIALRHGREQHVALLHKLMPSSVLASFYRESYSFEHAFFFGHKATVELLLELPFYRSFQFTRLLALSVSYGYVDIFSLLAKKCPSSLLMEFHDGKTLLHLAAEYGHSDMVEMLIAKGVPVTALSGKHKWPSQSTALAFATYHNRPYCIKALYDAASLCAPRALFWAIRLGFESCVDVLLNDCKMNPSVVCDSEGRLFPIHVACAAVSSRILRSLLKAGADVHQADKTPLGDYPLNHIVSNPIVYIEHTKILLDAGADVNKLNKKGDSVLVSLLRNFLLESADLLNLLLKHGVALDVNHILMLCLFRKEMRQVQQCAYEDILIAEMEKRKLGKGRFGDPHFTKALHERFRRRAAEEGLELSAAHRNVALSFENIDRAHLAAEGPIKDPRALCELGMKYLNGEGGYSKNEELAIQYLCQAAEKGILDAQVALAKLALDGTCSAVSMFPFILQAANSGDREAQAIVGKFYALGHGCARDSDRARHWFQRAKQQGWTDETEEVALLLRHFAVKDTLIEELIRFGEQLCAFEKQQHVAPDLFLNERMNRYGKHLTGGDPILCQVQDVFSKLQAMPPPTLAAMSMRTDVATWLSEMSKRATAGSLTAQGFFRSAAMCAHALSLLRDGQCIEGLRLARASYRFWDLPLWEKSDWEFMQAAAKSVLNTNPNQPDAMFMSALDTKLSNAERVRRMEHCVKLHPREADLYYYLGCYYGYVESWDNCLLALEHALELYPSRHDWLYDRASAYRLREPCDPHIAIQAYERFLRANPPDHRKVPEALYCIAQLMLQASSQGPFDEVLQFWQRAQAAEDPEVRLPCFMPVGDCFPPKATVQVWVEAIWPAFRIKICGYCRKVSTTHRCPCTTVHYCNKECQRQHWNVHKIQCTARKQSK